MSVHQISATNGNSGKFLPYIKSKLYRDQQNDEKNYLVEKKLLNDSVTIDNKLRIALLLVTVIALIIYKLFGLFMPHVNSENFAYMSKYARNHANYGYTWLYENKSLIYSIIAGISFSILSGMIVYLDIDKRVHCTSISSRSVQSKHKTNWMHINFLSAIGSGLLVTILMLVQ